jgi:predicted transcriptional regulator
VLRLLALWVSYAYSADHQKAVASPLIELGSAPLQDPTFRAAVFEELGEDRLTVPVETDIAGRADAHAVVLDGAATDSIKRVHLHQKVATSIFFESTGGMSPDKSEAALSEIKAAIGGPEVNLAELDTVLEGLVQTCFYLRSDKHRYRYSLRPNLNQVLVSRRGAVSGKAVDDRVRKLTSEIFQKVSSEGPKTVDRRFFPVQTNDVPDKPQLAIVVLDAANAVDNPTAASFIEEIVRTCGSSARVFKSALVFAVPASAETAREAAREALAWEDIAEDEDTLSQLEEHDVTNLKISVQRAKQNAAEAVWRMYRHVYLLNKDGTLQHVDLGQITSSMAPSLTELIVNELTRVDEVTSNVGVTRMVNSWQGVTPEWSTKSARDAFYASPKLPRPLDPDFIKATISRGVCDGELGYAHKDGDRFVLDRFGESMSELEVEIADDIFVFRKEDAQKLLEPPHAASLRISPSIVRLEPGSEAVFKVECFDQYGKPFEVDGVEWSSPEGAIDASGRLEVGDFQGVFVVTAKSGEMEAEAQVTVATTTASPPPTGDRFIHWEGEIPTQRWMQFYTKVLAGSATDEDLKLHVSVWLPTSAEQAEAKLNETRAALRDLGLDGSANVAD